MSLQFIEVKDVHGVSKEWRVCRTVPDRPRKISNWNFGRIHRADSKGEYFFEAQTWASLTLQDIKEIVAFLEKANGL